MMWMTNGKRSHAVNNVQQQGFTLLEAIVAMVLISTSGMALFGWINQNIATLSHIQESNAHAQAMTDVLEYMRIVNPMLMPEGKVQLGERLYVWQSQRVGDLAEGAGLLGPSLYQFALYDTQVMAANGNNPAWMNLRLRQVGFKRVRMQPTGV